MNVDSKEDHYFWLPRVVVEGLEKGQVLPLPSQAAYHLRVRRVGLHQRFLATDGEGKEGVCRLVAIDPMTAEVEEVFNCEDRELSRCPVLAFSVVKDQRLEWAIKGAVEMGMRRLLPMITRRSLPRVSCSKLERWRRIAVEAMKQCGGVLLPEVLDPVAFDELQGWRGAFFSPRASGLFIESRIEDIELLAIGPEGGFTPEEEETMLNWGWRCYNLGPRVLRTDTAMVAVAAITAQRMWRER